MRLTAKQAYVLENLERVRRHNYQLFPRKKRLRFQLDGSDCTQQVFSLSAKKLVTLGRNGLVRLPTCSDVAASPAIVARSSMPPGPQRTA